MSANSEHSAERVQKVGGTDVDEHLAALVGNAAAVAAVASAVQGTLGTKGLDTMLVDRFGDVTVTNDGVTILDKMDVKHPAARLVINAARAQDRQVGDGTTTATLIASALITEGVAHVRRGVPVTKIIEGIQAGINAALEVFAAHTQQVAGPDDPLLYSCALVAGRGDEQIARLAVEAARILPAEWLKSGDSFQLADLVIAQQGVPSQVISGLVLQSTRMNRQMPEQVRPATILVIDDALQPEEIEEEALATEAGFERYIALQNHFRDGLRRVLQAGVNCLFVTRGICDEAEQLITEAGAMAVRRVGRNDIARICEHTGARPVKRSALTYSPQELVAACGRADCVREDTKLGHLHIVGGSGRPTVTIVVGAATPQVRDERMRIARDACAAVQAAIRGGVLPGGGAIEIAAARQAGKLRDQLRGMAAYGVDCVIEALKRPLAQIVANAGFNPLEKVEDVISRQAQTGNPALAIDCDSGQVTDMVNIGVLDAAPVKEQALRTALEIARAILRINVVIRKKDEAQGSQP